MPPRTVASSKSKPAKQPAAKPSSPSKAKAAAAVPAPKPPADRDKALLAAVIGEPADDAPRLVYADHLSSAGDPRGEFIQVQCLLRRRLWGADGRSGANKSDPTPPNAEQLRLREMELFGKHAKAWLASARPYIQIWCWARGFLDIVEANAKFLPGAAAVLAEHPINLNLSALKPPDLLGLATAELHDLRALELIGKHLNNKTVKGLLGSNLSGLQVLNTTNTGLRDDGIIELATHSHLTSLRTWSLSGVALEAGAAAIAASPVLRSLRVLDVRNTGIDAAGVVAIARSTKLSALSKVVLGAYVTGQVGPEAVAELARRCEVITVDD